MAKLNFRLVPDQDPSEIEQLVRKHIVRSTPLTLRATTMTHFAAKPVVVDRHHPFLRVAAAACHRGFGSTPVFLRSGGTNAAVSAFQNILEQPTALIGFGLPDDQIHGPNEKFHLPNFHKGIATSISFLHEAGGAAPGVISHLRPGVAQQHL
jgi:acetylornithine deacetylase/succinyl-diaminopimelate desuccinylase-like protein